MKAFYFNPEDPSTTSQGFQANPLYNATLSSFSTARTQNLRNTVDAKWEITPDFYVSGQFNVDIESRQSDRYGEPTAWAPARDSTTTARSCSTTAVRSTARDRDS